jgi:hypothetical protein
VAYETTDADTRERRYVPRDVEKRGGLFKAWCRAELETGGRWNAESREWGYNLGTEEEAIAWIDRPAPNVGSKGGPEKTSSKSLGFDGPPSWGGPFCRFEAS